jgi:hypothetical protein
MGLNMGFRIFCEKMTHFISEDGTVVQKKKKKKSKKKICNILQVVIPTASISQ